MNRPWNIAEQVIEDPTTKLRIEFTSVHTVEVEQGRPAPLHDEIIYLRLWTSDRTRVATYAFTRGGQFIKTAVEHVDPGVHPKLEDGIVAAHTEDYAKGTLSGLAGEAVLEPQEVHMSKVGMGEDLARQDSEPVQPVPGSDVFDDINYAKAFVGDI